MQESAPIKTTQSSQKQRSVKKNVISLAIFFLLAGLTFYVIFHGNDMSEVAVAIARVHPGYLVLAAVLGLFFVSAEGLMIWYLMHSIDKKAKLLRCIKYSFVGFFFSGITPSATGGQPVQLYYMNKDKLKVSESTVVLMTVAVLYKLVLVMMGLGILLFAHDSLIDFLGGYVYLYYLGLTLNVVVVAVLLFIMISPKIFRNTVLGIEKLLVRLHILKPSEKRMQTLTGFTERYQETVQFFLKNKHKVVITLLITIVQRISVFVLTYVIYRGFELSGTSAFTVILLQASVYIAVDMLPLPGAQGITELMYKRVFQMVFPGSYLTASMCVTRGINFYFLMIVSAAVTLYCYIQSKLRKEEKVLLSAAEANNPVFKTNSNNACKTNN